MEPRDAATVLLVRDASSGRQVRFPDDEHDELAAEREARQCSMTGRRR